MQKMLVTLVVILTGAVAVLAFSVLSLKDDIAALSLRQGRTRTATRPPEPVRPEPARSQVDERELRSLRIKVADLQSKYSHVRQQLDRTLARLAAYRVRDEDGVDPGGFEDAEATPIPGRARGADGNWDISAEEIDYAIALQKKVDRRRRLDSMFRNVQRRVDGLIEKGELNPIPEEHTERFNKAVAGFLAASDDLMTRFFREPSDELRRLDARERREMLKAEREALQVQAQTELAAMLGDEQAEVVADTMFRRGWRYGSRRGRRGGSGLPRRR